jgi:hypothetical protein
MNRLNIVLASILLTAAATVPASASNGGLGKATCRRGDWVANGLMLIKQANGYDVKLNMYQDSGDAYSVKGGMGNASISISGRRFETKIAWIGGTTGIYTAYINENGSLSNGMAYNAQKTSSMTEWSTTNQLRACEK